MDAVGAAVVRTPDAIDKYAIKKSMEEGKNVLIKTFKSKEEYDAYYNNIINKYK